MPDDDMADVRAAFARLNEDDVVPGPVGQTLADRLTERVTEAPSVLEEAVPPPQSAAVPGPAGVPAAPVAGVPAPVAPVGGTPSSQPTVLPPPEPAASTPPVEPRPPDTPAGPPPETPPSAGIPAPADPDDSAAEPAPETPAEPTPDTPGEPTDTPGESASDTPGEPVDESPAEPEAGTDPDSPSPEDPVAESDTDGPEKPDDDVPAEPAPEDSESSQEPVQSATTAAPVSKPDGWQVDSYELRAFTDAVMRARSYLDAVQAKADRMQGAEMTPQLGTSPVGKQLAKKFDDRLNSTDGLRAMLAEAMKRMEDFVTSAEKAARSYEELEESAVANLQSAKRD